jgi:hypothetical protein
MDIMTRLPRTTRGFDAIAIFVEAQTQYVRIVPINKAVNGTQFATIFHDTIFRHYGIPKSLVSNKNVKFTTDLWKEFTTLIGTNINLMTTFEPEQGEQTHFMEHVIRHLRSFLTPYNSDWYKYLLIAEFALYTHESLLHPIHYFTTNMHTYRTQLSHH